MALFDRVDRGDFETIRADYRRDGVVCLRRVFDEADLFMLRETVTAAAEAPSDHIEVFGETAVAGRPRRFFVDTELTRFPPFERFLLHSIAAELAARLMGSQVARYFLDQLLVKEPGTAKRTPWHQDLPYWPIRGRQVCSMWLPIDPVDRATCVAFVAGSHEWPDHSPLDFRSGRDYGPQGMPRLPEIDAARHKILSYDMEPGDCIVFHGMTAHGAPGNATTRPRRAFSIRWAGDDVRHHYRAADSEELSVGRPALDGQPLGDDGYPVLWRDAVRE